MTQKGYGAEFRTCFSSTMSVSSGCSSCLADQAQQSFSKVQMCFLTCVPTVLKFMVLGDGKMDDATRDGEVNCLKCVMPHVAKLAQCSEQDQDEVAQKLDAMVDQIKNGGVDTVTGLIQLFVK